MFGFFKKREEVFLKLIREQASITYEGVKLLVKYLETQALAALYAEKLDDVPGIQLPLVPDGDRSTFKDLTVLVEPELFGIDADALAAWLSAVGIETRRYYSPPVHRMRAYASLGGVVAPLPETDRAAHQALNLPLGVGMGEGAVERVATAIREAADDA